MLRTYALKPALGDVFKGLEDDLAVASTEAMRGATKTLKEALRDQIKAAGLGGRLANTWRGDTYPDAPRFSLNPAGYAWSNAPDIITAFASGAVIRPMGGHKYLWIPTKAVPRAQGGGRTTSTKKMTPEQVLASFGATQFVILRGKRGHLLAYLPEDRGQTKRGRVRKARRGRLAHGETEQLLLLFTLVTETVAQQLLDLQAAADVGVADYVERFNQAVR